MGDAKSPRDTTLLTSEQREELLRAAVECYGRGELAQTQAILEGLTGEGETDARAFKLLGSTLLLQGRHGDAERVYERALALDADDPYTLVALGEIKLKSLKLREAIPLFEKLFDMDPNGEHPAANRGRELVQEQYKKMAGSR